MDAISEQIKLGFAEINHRINDLDHRLIETIQRFDKVGRDVLALKEKMQIVQDAIEGSSVAGENYFENFYKSYGSIRNTLESMQELVDLSLDVGSIKSSVVSIHGRLGGIEKNLGIPDNALSPPSDWVGDVPISRKPTIGQSSKLAEYIKNHPDEGAEK